MFPQSWPSVIFRQLLLCWFALKCSIFQGELSVGNTRIWDVLTFCQVRGSTEHIFTYLDVLGPQWQERCHPSGQKTWDCQDIMDKTQSVAWQTKSEWAPPADRQPEQG